MCAQLEAQKRVPRGRTARSRPWTRSFLPRQSLLLGLHCRKPVHVAGKLRASSAQGSRTRSMGLEAVLAYR